MKSALWFFCFALVLLTGPAALTAEQPAGGEKRPPPGRPEVSGTVSIDEEWLHAIWTQVDEMVKEERRLQKTVSSAGVPPARQEIGLLDRLYYRGAKRISGLEEIRLAIAVLEQAVAGNPKGAGAPRRIYLTAQCYQKLGRLVEANGLYTRLTRDHAGTPWAARASRALAKLAEAGRAIR